MAMANCSGSADESNSVTEESVERNFRAFRLYMEKNIKASDLIAGYEFFTTEHRKTIWQLNKLDPSGAIKEALDIVEGIDEPGKYVHFLQTLEDMEYPKLVSVLNGSLVPVNYVNRKMIPLFARHVFRYLKPTNILPYLLSKSVITENDAQTIRNIEGNDSTGNAAIELMLLLPNRSKDWYMLFLEALVDGKHEDLADLIDRETKEKIVATRQAGELISMSMGVSLQPRNVVEKEKIQVDQDIGGPASSNNLDPPDQKFISLVSLFEMLEENNDNSKEYSLSDTGEKIRDNNDRKTKQRKTKDIFQMNSLNFTKCDETSLPSAPRSPESNSSEMRPNFGDETSPKLLYDRAPPEGSEVGHNTYQVSPENKQVDVKVMKDKDLSASAEEDKMDNNRANIIDEEIVATRQAGELISMSMGVSLQPRNVVEKEKIQVDQDIGGPASSNNLDPPDQKFISLVSLFEMLEENNDNSKEYSLSDTGEKIRDNNDRKTKQRKTKDIFQMNSLNFTKCDETSLPSAPRSPESNSSEMRPNFGDETSPKLLYDRAPPEGSEVGHNTYQVSPENKQVDVKVMKDKDLSASAEEDKMDNNRANIIDEEPDVTPDIVDENITLREYQKELAAPAFSGKNVLIVAPTGSGKTRVALKIIQEHMRAKKGREIAKVIFLVHQVALANQQAEACNNQLKKYSTKVICGNTQRSKGECLKDFIYRRDILVVTAQVLVDALANKEIDSITKFSLMIFDECHHTHAKHPFNQIMRMYLDLKLDEKFDKTALPQIIGLTASAGVGKAKDLKQAVEHIKSLMANLDSEVICTVQHNMSELRQFVSIPDEDLYSTQKKHQYIRSRSYKSHGKNREKDVSTSTCVTRLEQAAQFEATLRAPAEKGTAQYTQWLSRLWKETAILRSQEARRFLNPCRAHLEYYNNALIIYNDARVQDALLYLKENMKRWKENAVMNDDEQKLEKFYKATQQLPFHLEDENPKLNKLKDMILKGCRDEDSRGIIFVKTRDLATAIVSWMKETPRLKELNAIKFVGQNESADKGGMTKAEQEDALKYFRNGKHKILVATSVAEEGLDIRKCNLIIRYDHVTNEIAMVQSRGRGRAEDSKYVLVAEKGKRMAEKEELNMIREILMRKAIIQLQIQIMDLPRLFKDEICKLQDPAKLKRELKAAKRKGKRMLRGEFELRCLKCSEFICMSSDVKKVQNAYHVCVDESLKDRVDYVRGASKYIDETIQLVGKLICNECGYEVGVITIHKTLEFPVLKIDRCLIVEVYERQDICKKWNQAPFEPQPLSIEDFRAILQQRKDTGEI